jgi:hypothetical protein
MARTDPSVNLSWCESHVVMKAVLANGEVLRLGTGTLTNVEEEDSLKYSYEAKILKDSQVRLSTTQSANLLNVDAENVDKELGLTINDVNSTLQGAKITASKVFSDIYSLDISDFSPRIWFNGDKIRGFLPNQTVTSWEDLSGNNSNASGTAVFSWKTINGRHALSFSNNDAMGIFGSFPLAQVFVVFKSDFPSFVGSGSILGSLTPAFKFANNTTEFTSPFPSGVRSNGLELVSPFPIGDLTQTKILNIKTSSPTTTRNYIINNQDGVRMDFKLAELIGFTNELSPAEEQNVEYILSRKYGVNLPYVPTRTWDRKILMVGEISGVEVNENIVRIKIVSDIAPNVAFIAARPVGTNCPLVFKGVRCGYSGPLTTCNKVYISEGGCSGRENQHRFGGVVIEGELNRIIPGDIDTTIGNPSRFWDGNHYPEVFRNREILF